MPKAEFSAGGVVVRGDEVIVIVPVKRDADGDRVLGLPKGHPDGDETPEQAATPRGARGDRASSAELVEELGEIHYRYERKGRHDRQAGRASSCSSTARETSPTTITRSRRPAGCRSRRRPGR